MIEIVLTFYHEIKYKLHNLKITWCRDRVYTAAHLLYKICRCLITQLVNFNVKNL